MIVNEGGKKLPKLTTPGTSADLLTGKELIDQYGRKIEGNMPYLYTANAHGNIHFSNDIGMVYTDVLFDHEGYTTFLSLSSSRKITTDDCPNLLPENIVSGKMIFGVTGTAKKYNEYYSSISHTDPNLTYTDTAKFSFTIPGDWTDSYDRRERMTLDILYKFTNSNDSVRTCCGNGQNLYIEGQSRWLQFFNTTFSEGKTTITLNGYLPDFESIWSVRVRTFK